MLSRCGSSCHWLLLRLIAIFFVVTLFYCFGRLSFFAPSNALSPIFFSRPQSAGKTRTATQTPSTQTILATTAPNTVEVQAKTELVVAATRGENITWLHDYLVDLPKKIYVVDDPSAEYTVPQNKGNEAMVYLTYIIDRYDSLPDYIIFHHALRFQWHNDDPDYDALQLLKRFRLRHLQKQGYANLRCSWDIGCPLEIRPHEHGDSATQDDGIPHAQSVYKAAFSELFPGVGVPATVGVPCCGQFAVTKETVRLRPRTDYVRFRDWLLETKLPSSKSGRVFEYAWHIIFGKESVHCPNARSCYCKQYGICTLTGCTESNCPGQFTMPKLQTLPDGWPWRGWEGEDRHWSGEL